MGGIGKTTLAKDIFNRLEPSFACCCSFLENVRENLQSKKLVNLQRQLYKDIISHSLADSIHSQNDGINKLREGLENKKFLLVLDDVDDANQLTDLLGHHVHFASGSRIIMTTRDKRVLTILHGKYNVIPYELKEMDDVRALKLFSRSAFMMESPPMEFQRLSKEVVSYTGGLPLALEVIGSLLFRNSEDAWKETLEELKKFPDKSMESRMMISYQGLKINQQKIFLDIACYNGNLDKRHACFIWEDSGWHPESAINTLKDRSLIKIVDFMGIEYFRMHDVLKDLGRAIVQDEGDKSNKIPNGLRIDNNLDILHEIEEKEHIETLIIHAPTITIKSKDMVGLHNLRFLELRVQKVEGDFSGLFPNMRWFCCSYVTDFKLVNFNPKRLLVFELSNSNFTRSLEGWRIMKVDKLKVLDLSSPTLHYLMKLFSCFAHNDQVIRLTDETWSLGGYVSHLNVKWILNAANLEELRLDVAYPITGLEEMGKLLRLKHLHLSMVIFQYRSGLPSSLLHLTLIECEFLGGILDVSNMNDLKYLEISSPRELNEMKGLGELRYLEELILEGLDCIKILWDLIQPKCLQVDPNMEGCSNLTGIPHKMPKLESLEKFKLVDCKNLSCIEGLNILKNLKELELVWCHSLGELPDISSLKRLSSLNLSWCKNMVRIVSFDGLETLTSLSLDYCLSIETLPDLSSLRKLQRLKLQGCDKLKGVQGIPKLESLEIVHIVYCNCLELNPVDLENVQSVHIDYCNKLPPIKKGTIPSSFL